MSSNSLPRKHPRTRPKPDPSLPILLTQASAEAYARVDRRNIVKFVSPVAWLLSTSGDKQFALFSAADVAEFAKEHPELHASWVPERAVTP